MCHPTTCTTCGKTTWSGCGLHIAQVRTLVPTDQWCTGHETSTSVNWLRRLIRPSR